MSSTLKKSESLEKILNLLGDISKGKLEVRLTNILEDTLEKDIANGINNILDQTEAFMKEAILSLYEHNKGTSRVRIDRRGYNGTYSHALFQFNLALDRSLRQKQEIETILENLGQAYMTCDRAGQIKGQPSSISTDIFGIAPTGLNICDVLRLEGEERKGVLEWVKLVFEEPIDFVDLKPIGPKNFDKVEGKFIELDYQVIRNKKGKIARLVVIGTDKTEEKKFKEKAAEEAAYVKAILSMVTDKQNFIDFVTEVQSILEYLKKTFSRSRSEIDVDHCFRLIHSVKGGAASFGLRKIGIMAHNLENEFTNLDITDTNTVRQEMDKKRKSFKNDIKKIEERLNDFLDKNDNILGLKKILISPTKELIVKKVESLGARLKKENGADSNLYKEYLRDFILEPIGDAFQHFERASYQVAEKLGKEVKFSMINGELKFYRPVYKPLISSLIHAFRNAVDHGIESPNERENKNKKPYGKIKVEFKTKTKDKKKFILIQIEDDGNGIDPEIIGELAVSKSLVTEDELKKMTNEEIIQLVMKAGFSSKEEATDMSGRGVGLDAIKFEAERLKGKAWVESKKNKGSKLFVEVPLYQEIKK